MSRDSKSNSYVANSGPIYKLQFTARGTTGSPSSLVTVNMTLRNGVIIRDCVGNTSILRNSSKYGKNIIKSTYFFLLCV